MPRRPHVARNLFVHRVLRLPREVDAVEPTRVVDSNHDSAQGRPIEHQRPLETRLEHEGLRNSDEQVDLDRAFR